MHIYDNRISSIFLESIHEFKHIGTITENAPEVLHSVHFTCIVTYSHFITSFRSFLFLLYLRLLSFLGSFLYHVNKIKTDCKTK